MGEIVSCGKVAAGSEAVPAVFTGNAEQAALVVMDRLLFTSACNVPSVSAQKTCLPFAAAVGSAGGRVPLVPQGGQATPEGFESA